MKKLIIILFFLPSLLLAQKHDYVWKTGHLGADYPETNFSGTTVWDFSDLSKLQREFDGYGKIDFSITCTNISNEEGNYLFSYNGEYIENAQNDTMPNSIGLSNSGIPGGDLTPQGGLILPLPGSESKYVLVHMSTNYFDGSTNFITGHVVQYSIIDMEKNNGLGEVTSKRNLLLADTLAYGQLTATKHANGRDWWILVSKPSSKTFYRLLLTPEGVSVMGEQSIGGAHKAGVGLAHFTPDGSKYIKYGSVSKEKGEFLHIFDFDRCTGLLSNSKSAHFFTGEFGSISISPDSKILYLIAWDKIYQYDLTIENILETKTQVAESDGYLDPVFFDWGDDTLYFEHAFWLGQLAPNGKIYISATFTNNKLIHVIHNPNIWGAGCHVEQHVHLPTFNRTIPNFPNYRLGPIDGSICDSLGINNMPLARFRYDQDTNDMMEFHFIDLSNYEPTAWSWDFGDGTTSTDANPAHLFAQTGVYPVCLTVSNENGSHTMCDTLHLGVVATKEIATEVNIPIWPNPFSDYLVLSFYDYYPQNANIYFYDVTGRFLRKQQLRYGENELDVLDLPKGMIFYMIRDGLISMKRGKLIHN